MKNGEWRILLAVGLLSAPAWADVDFTVSPEPYYVGSPITLSIDVINEPNHEEPRVPPIEGAEIRGPNKSTSNQISIIQGRQTVTESVSYRFEIIPRRAGALQLPSIEVMVNGEAMRTSPRVIQVEKSDAEDLLFVEVHADRDSVYLGESVELKLDIWLRPVKNRQANFGSYNDMWQCVDLRRSAWGPFAVLLQDTKNISVNRQVRKGADGVNREYFVYTMSRTHWPERAGPLDLGDISVIIEYPLQVGRDNSVFSFFNEPRILRSRPLSAPATVDRVTVKPIPTHGQPADYNGAVGRYEFEVAAKPTEVHVGDPITLTLTLRGGGRLDLLQPPKLEQVEELVKHFKLPSDLLAGTVEGDAKRFTQTIRARDASVTEIPALPFSYFETKSAKFVTVRSDPIPIQVSESDRLSVSNAVEAETGQRVSTRLTRRGEGIVANYYDVNLLLANQAFSPGAQAAACVAVPPLAFGASVLIRRRRERLRKDVGYARRHRARATAMRALDRCEEVKDPQEQAALSLAAVAGYVADRCGLPAGAMTRAEIVEQLRRSRVREETARGVDAVLADCEGLRYAGGAGVAGDSLPSRARRCIEMLAQERL